MKTRRQAELAAKQKLDVQKRLVYGVLAYNRCQLCLCWSHDGLEDESWVLNIAETSLLHEVEFEATKGRFTGHY